MVAANIIGAVERWHCRVLGVLWAVGGLAWLAKVLPNSTWWDDAASWFGIIVASSLVAIGFGLAFRRVWARWCILPLMVASALISVEGVLVAGCCGAFLFVVLSLVGLGAAIYTTIFVALSLCMIYRD